MKKTLLKLLATIVGLIIIIFFQGFIRDYFSIDPRIWFFVQYVGIIFLIVSILTLFTDDIVPMKHYLNKMQDYKNNRKDYFENWNFFITCKNNKLLRISYKIFDCLFWIPATAILFFNNIYSDIYTNNIEMKIVSFIFYFIFTLNLFINYIRYREKNLNFINFLCYSIITIFTLADIFFSII